MKSDKKLYVFDFDGTLVKQTRFQNLAQNYKDFLEFEIFINPTAFCDNWQILSSRPHQDEWLVESVINRFNLHPNKITVMESDDPMYNTEIEYGWKLTKLKQIINDNPTKSVIYVDNSIAHRNWLSERGILCMSVSNFICHTSAYDSDGNFI